MLPAFDGCVVFGCLWSGRASLRLGPTHPDRQQRQNSVKLCPNHWSKKKCLRWVDLSGNTRFGTSWYKNNTVLDPHEWLAGGGEGLNWSLCLNYHLKVKSFMLTHPQHVFQSVHINLLMLVLLYDAHARVCADTCRHDHRRIETQIFINKLTDQCQGLLILMRLGVLPLWCFLYWSQASTP